MISMTRERAPSLRDILDSASNRLGIKQFAGGIGLPQPLKKLCITRFDNLDDLSWYSLSETICILPLRAFPFNRGAQFSSNYYPFFHGYLRQ